MNGHAYFKSAFPTANEWLSTNLHRHVRWGGSLANHQSMAIVSMVNLGFSDQQIAAFAEHYDNQLEPMFPLQGSLQTGDWHQALGQMERIRDIYLLFNEQIQHAGSSNLLASTLPHLSCGLVADGFHPMLRVAYGLQANLPSEIALGLAYWVASYRELPLPKSPHAHSLTPAEAWATLASSTSASKRSSQTGLIADRLIQAATHSAIQSIVSRVHACSDDLSFLARFARLLHTQSASFTTLHVMTAVHAARRISERLPSDSNHLFTHLARAVLTAWGSEGFPPIQAPFNPTASSWRTILQRLTGSVDDHAYKLVWCCLDESKTHGHDEVYRSIASDWVTRSNSA